MFTKLAIGLTDKCTAACDMCCFGCSPKGEMHLETDLIKDVTLQASRIEGIRAIGFTGGEPLIYFDQVLECCRYAKSLGLHITINSNGFWGANEERANEMAAALQKAGVALISFSADKYHQQYVPIEHLKAAIRATLRAGMLGNISVMETNDSDNIVKMTEALRPEIYQIELAYHPMLPIGKALETTAEGEYIKNFDSKYAKCTFAGMVHLNFDGNYYMCCSQFCKEIPPINLGSAKEVKLQDLEQKILTNDYLYVMLRNGLTWYIDLARELGFEIPSYLCSPCHCCYFVFRNHEFLEKSRERVKQEAGRLRVQHLLGMSA